MAVTLAVVVWAAIALPETRPRPVTGGGVRFIGMKTARCSQTALCGYVLVAALGSATFFAFLGGGPHVVVTMMGRTSAEYGAWFAITALGFMLGNLSAARLSRATASTP